MSDDNKEKKTISAYQQLSGILNSLKKNEISLNEAMNQIQLKDSKPSRPYCKVTNSGALALYGISKQPIVMYADQWTKLNKLVQNNYIDNYIKYNQTRLSYKKKYSNMENEKINTHVKSNTYFKDNNVKNFNGYGKNKEPSIVPGKIILKKKSYFNDDLIKKNSVNII